MKRREWQALVERAHQDGITEGIAIGRGMITRGMRQHARLAEAMIPNNGALGAEMRAVVNAVKRMADWFDRHT